MLIINMDYFLYKTLDGDFFLFFFGGGRDNLVLVISLFECLIFYYVRIVQFKNIFFLFFELSNF